MYVTSDFDIYNFKCRHFDGWLFGCRQKHIAPVLLAIGEYYVVQTLGTYLHD
jgi:hypothetical protein